MEIELLKFLIFEGHLQLIWSAIYLDLNIKI